jgi:hypothetical protein
MTLTGTIILGVGMFFCAFLIERATDEVKYKRKRNSKSRIFWCQIDDQHLGDQVFKAFIGVHDDAEYLVSRLRQEYSRSVLLILTVTFSLVGFILQFIGLRAMHSSVSLAQLGAISLMALTRSSLRTKRRGGERNLLYKHDRQQSIKGHELDFLTMELEEGALLFPSFVNGAQAFSPPNPLQTSENAVNNLVENTVKAQANFPPLPTRLVMVRTRLAHISARSPGLHQGWCPRIQEWSAHLKQTIEQTMNATSKIFQTKSIFGEPPGLVRIESDFTWEMPLSCMSKQSAEDQNLSGADAWRHYELERGTYLLRAVQNRSVWMMDQEELEALLGLWTWSTFPPATTPRYDPVRNPTRRVVGCDDGSGNYKYAADHGFYGARHLILDSVTDRASRDLFLDGAPQDNRIYGGMVMPSNMLTDILASENGNSSIYCTNTSNTPIRMFAQDLYVQFLTSLLKRVTRLLLPTVVVEEAFASDFFLQNGAIEILADAFEVSGLGSRDDAYTCIVPALRTASLLPQVDTSALFRDLGPRYGVFLEKPFAAEGYKCQPTRCRTTWENTVT